MYKYYITIVKNKIKFSVKCHNILEINKKRRRNGSSIVMEIERLNQELCIMGYSTQPSKRLYTAHFGKYSIPCIQNIFFSMSNMIAFHSKQVYRLGK